MHPNKAGLEIIETLRELDEKKLEEQQIYSTVYSLLSFEKITFNGNFRWPILKTNSVFVCLFNELFDFFKHICLFIKKW